MRFRPFFRASVCNTTSSYFKSLRISEGRGVPFIPLPGVIYLMSHYYIDTRDISSPPLLPLPLPQDQTFLGAPPLLPRSSEIPAAAEQGFPSVVLTTPQGSMLRYTWFCFSCGASFSLAPLGSKPPFTVPEGGIYARG